MSNSYPLDRLRLLWVRVTVCRTHGHHYWIDADYCRNCGAPAQGQS
ncbi:MAG: hypothetical protein ACXVXN_02045 [Mycobacteriaceae bacterium]